MRRASEITDVSVTSHPEYRFPILDVPILSARETSPFPRETFYVFSARDSLQFLSAKLCNFSTHQTFRFLSERETRTLSVTIGR
jgi:hypothetical protein